MSDFYVSMDPELRLALGLILAVAIAALGVIAAMRGGEEAVAQSFPRALDPDGLCPTCDRHGDVLVPGEPLDERVLGDSALRMLGAQEPDAYRGLVPLSDGGLDEQPKGRSKS